MATQRLRTIKPTGQGGDYTTLSAWEAGEQADLVSLDEIRIGEIDGDWTNNYDTLQFGVNGWTTDSTRYVIIRAIGTARHNGKWDDTKYRIIINDAGYDGASFQILEEYTKVYGIQLQASSNANVNHIGLSVNQHYLFATIEGCIVKKGTGNYLNRAIEEDWYHGNSYFINCIVYNAVYGYYLGGSNNTLTAYIYNCTAYNCSIGFFSINSGLKIAKNCLTQTCTDGFSGTWQAASTNNISDIGDAPGSNPINGTVRFVDAANYNFTLSPYDTVALGAGANLYADTYAVTTDIAGNARGNGAFDIGASHATQVIRTIKQSGGNYTTLAAWESAMQADLTAVNKVSIAEIDGEWTVADTTAVAIDGWTTNSINYIEVRAIEAAKHSGRWDTTKYIIQGAGSAYVPIINLVEPYVRIKDILIYVNGNQNGITGVNFDNIGNINSHEQISNVIVKCNNIYDRDQYGFRNINTGISNVLINCIAYNFTTAASIGFDLSAPSSVVINLYNCFAYNCRIGFRDSFNDRIKAVNCLAQNCTDGFDGTFAATSTNNCSNITSDAPGSNPVTGTVQFTDSANGDFSLSPYDTVALGNGTNLYADAIYPVTTDILGVSRGTASAAVYDIGAFHSLTKIRNIKPSGQGGNYTSLSAWEAAQQADLVALNKISIGEIDGTWASAETTAVDIEGWVTDSTRNIIIRAIGLARHEGKWSALKYMLTDSRGGDLGQIGIGEDYVTIEGIQIYLNTNGSDIEGIRLYGTGTNIKSCLFRGTAGTGDYYSGIIAYNVSANAINYISNCIFWNFNGSNTSFGVIVYEDADQTVSVYNCTSYNCYGNTWRHAGTVIVKNCLASLATDGFSGLLDGSSVNNISANASFIDSANGDFRLTESDRVAKARGVNLTNDSTYPFNTDIVGTERSFVWDIGAHQVTKKATIKNAGKLKWGKRIVYPGV